MLISIRTDIDEKWFVFYEHSIGHPSFICVYLDYFPFFLDDFPGDDHEERQTCRL